MPTYDLSSNHLGGGAPIGGWHGRAVVPFYAQPGSQAIAAIVDRAGDPAGSVFAPPSKTLYRFPIRPVVSWPTEQLVIGLYSEHGSNLAERRFDLLFVNLDGSTSFVELPNDPTALRGSHVFDVVPTADDALIISYAVAREPHRIHEDWPIDTSGAFEVALFQVREWAIDEHEYVMNSTARTGVRRWEATGRLASLAGDVAVIEDGIRAARTIVGRSVLDGQELWRRPGEDQFVLGTTAMPGLSYDRVYVLDRAARRREAWAREAAAAADWTRAGESGSADNQALIRHFMAFRAAHPLTARSIVSCLSTRTGAETWRSEIDGDVVSFWCHGGWVAWTIAGKHAATIVRWSHAGAELGRMIVERDPRHRLATAWPPAAQSWPCLVAGDDDHLMVALNRSQAGESSQLFCAPHGAERPLWEVALPAPCVCAPVFRYLRLLNHVPMAFTDGAAYLRWGKTMHAFVADPISTSVVA